VEFLWIKILMERFVKMSLNNIKEKLEGLKISGKYKMSEIVLAVEDKNLKLLRNISEYISGNVDFYDDLGDLKKNFKVVLDLVNEAVKILSK